MRALPTDGNALRDTRIGKGTAKADSGGTAGKATFAAALKTSVTALVKTNDDGEDVATSSAAPETTEMSERKAALERAVPGRTRERRSSERLTDGAAADVPTPLMVAPLPFERLQVRGLGMDAGGASDSTSDKGHSSPTNDDAATRITPPTRVIAGHVLGLSVAPVEAATGPAMMVSTGAPALAERGEAASGRPSTEALITGPSMGAVESGPTENGETNGRSAPTAAPARDASSSPVINELRGTTGAAAVLERSDAVASARQELGQSVNARPVPQGPTVEALPVGLGGGLDSAAQQKAGGGQSSRNGGSESDTRDRDDAGREPEASRGPATDGFVPPSHEARALDAAAGTSASSSGRPTSETSTTTERVVEIVEHLEVRSVESGRIATPLKVNLGELGEVRVSMTRVDGLSVRLDASDPRAAAAFESGRRELEMALEAHGLRELRVGIDSTINKTSALAPERPLPERVQLGSIGAETHGRQEEREGQMGQDRSGRQGSNSREDGDHDERDHRDAINAAFERRERERRFSPTRGSQSTGRPLGSA